MTVLATAQGQAGLPLYTNADVTYVLTLQRLQERAARTAAGFQERLGELPIAMPQMCAALHLLDTGEMQLQSPGHGQVFAVFQGSSLHSSKQVLRNTWGGAVRNASYVCSTDL